MIRTWMYSPMSYISLHLIFFRSHPHSKFQMNAIFFNHHFSFYTSVINLFYSRAHRSKSLQCVVALPRTSGYTSQTAVSLWWSTGGISTRSRYQAPSNAWWKSLSRDSESSDFFFPEKLTIQSYTWN